MTVAQEAFVAQLADKDRAYGQAIAVFRGAVTDIASTPEGAAALARFNNGDEVGALGILDKMRAAADKARETRAAIESAAGSAQDCHPGPRGRAPAARWIPAP